MSLDTAIREALLELVRSDPDVRAEIASLVSNANTGAEYLSTSAAADFASVHPATIRRWIREGKLTEHRAGSDLRIRRDELEKLLSGGEKRLESAETPEERAARDFGV